MFEEQMRQLMIDCFEAGVRACHPENCLAPHLPPAPDNGKLFLLAGGKAAGAMMKVAVDHYAGRFDRQRICGVAVGKPDGFVSVAGMTWIGAGHPVPDAGSIEGAKHVLHLAGQAGADDLVVVLLSGGASALWSAPVAGVSLADKQAITRRLLRSGADIIEINSVRKHLSLIKGGRLAQRAAPARVVSLVISDVAGDDPSFISSGPTVGDPTSLETARSILAKYQIEVPQTIKKALSDSRNETLAPDDTVFANTRTRIIASGAHALAAAGKRLQEEGFEVIEAGDSITGEAREVARRHGKQVLEYAKAGRPVAFLSGGELTVTVTGKGVGGPNQEYALALAMTLGETGGVYALAADTDGCDGGRGRASDPAGAMIFPSTPARARAQKLNPATFLADNDSGTFFKRLDDLLVTGSTQTNVNDFRLVLINNSYN